MVFKDPWFLIFLAFVPALYIGSRRIKSPAIRFSSTTLFKGTKENWKVRLSRHLVLLRLLVLTLFMIALAGPRSVLEKTSHSTEGIDIVLAIDSSGSMAAEDFTMTGKRYNRLEIVKKVVRDFIKKRTSDRIGLVTFAALAYTACPLTTDYEWLTVNLERIQLGLIKDGTAVGSAIASSLGRLKQSDAKSKIIILLTDGVNNAGKTDPLDAARAAAALGIKIYTIGAGSKGLVPFPVQDLWGRTVYRRVAIDLDEKTLKEIARISGGKYFLATDTESLEKIYDEIDTLEKTKTEESGYKEYKELFVYFLAAGLCLLVVEVLLSHTLFMKFP